MQGKIYHGDVIKWKLFPRYLPFVLGIHQSPMNSPHKGQWRGALMFSLICAAWINGWANNRDAGDLRRHCVLYDVTVMTLSSEIILGTCSAAERCHCLSPYPEWSLVLHLSVCSLPCLPKALYRRRYINYACKISSTLTSSENGLLFMAQWFSYSLFWINHKWNWYLQTVQGHVLTV